jgi:hypothetical protein
MVLRTSLMLRDGGEVSVSGVGLHRLLGVLAAEDARDLRTGVFVARDGSMGNVPYTASLRSYL